tara:strand:+ start:114 stop:335 length:222 start_codon:yes stop_codon:yes gene_type:complete
MTINKSFNSGDLVLYHRKESEGDSNPYCIIISHIHTDYEHYYKGGQHVSYFNCLVEGRKEAICDIWLKKTNLK